MGHRGGLLQLHVDAPAKWDAWELDTSYRLATTDVDGGTARLTETGDAVFPYYLSAVRPVGMIVLRAEDIHQLPVLKEET